MGGGGDTDAMGDGMGAAIGDGMGAAMGDGNAAGGAMGAAGAAQASTNMGSGMAATGVILRGEITNSFTGPQYNDIGRVYAERYDPTFDNPALACEASILFGITHHGLANEFVQLSDTELRWAYGYMDVVRHIHIDGEFPAQIQPSNSGYSVAKWEGDTLVVTTKGFKQGALFAIAGDRQDAISTINSEQLTVTERITYDKQRDALDVTWLAEDAGYWTNKMAGEFILSRSGPYEVYGCEELAGQNNVRPDGTGLFDIDPASLHNASAASSNAAGTDAATTSSASRNEFSRKLAVFLALLLTLATLGTMLYKRSANKDA